MNNIFDPKPVSPEKGYPSDYHFARILDSFALTASKPYQPNFHIEIDRLGWRIFDDKKSLGLLGPMNADIWSFSPFEPDEMANITPPGKVVDLHTVHNTVMGLGVQIWPKHWLEQGTLEERVKIDWIKHSGSELLARITALFADGESGEWLVRICYDPVWGRYRYTWDISVRKYDSDAMEGFNLMAAGALADREENRRWTHSIWGNADGGISRIVHSNALFYCTDYAAGGGIKRDVNGPWRWRNASYPTAWVGYGAHGSFNPFVLVHRTNVPLMFGTCSQLFDEHILWNRAGQENVDENGYFHFQMSVELVNLKQKMTQDLLRQGNDPVKPKRWRQNDFALPFYVDRVNTFAEELDPWKPEGCPFLRLPDNQGGSTAWDQSIGHNDLCSIRLVNSPGSEAYYRRELHPLGAVCKVIPQARYCLSGWIKGLEIDRFARLELIAFEYTYHNVTAFAASASVPGTCDWTHVEAVVETGDSAYVLPKFVLYGAGTAWFDDITLEKIS